MVAWKEAGLKVLPCCRNRCFGKTFGTQRCRRYYRRRYRKQVVSIGELTTFSLVPSSSRCCGSVPVVAAGGIATGRQVLAAFALGASGVQVGTCLLVSEECPIHQNYKEAICKAGDTDTIVTGELAVLLFVF